MNKIELMSITLFAPKIKFSVFNILLDHVANITEMYILLVLHWIIETNLKNASRHLFIQREILLKVFITCFSSLYMQKLEDWQISSIISSYLEYIPIQNLIYSSLLSNNNNHHHVNGYM